MTEMNSWEQWAFSPKTESRLNDFCKKNHPVKSLDSENQFLKIWLELFNHNFSEVSDSFDREMEVDVMDVDSDELTEIINLFNESIKTDATFPDTKLVGVSYNSLNNAFLSIKNSLSDEEFPGFCRIVKSWNDSALVELSLKSVILPKVKEKNELPYYMMFSLKELAVSKPEELCHNVLIPVLSDDSCQFSDVEALSNIFLALETPQQDLVILTLTKKENFKESYWSLLQPLIKNMSHNSVKNILNCIYRFSSEFATSQVFGRFLVNFCKNLSCINDKKLLLESIEKHQTLLKRLALKHLESL